MYLYLCGDKVSNDFFALVKKEMNISSFNFVNMIKNTLNLKGHEIKKIGFLGTLDPFASGNLLIATNSYTKLLSHIETKTKRYIATIFFGLDSRSIDIENIESLNLVEEIPFDVIKRACIGLRGKISYTPPIFSAKHIDGTRAYKLARMGCEVRLREEIMEIENFKILNYSHPFLSFQVDVSRGGYVRSICEIIVKNISSEIFYKDLRGSLCYLNRLNDGNFSYKNKNLEDKIWLNLKLNGTTQSICLAPLRIEKVLSYDTIKLASFCNFAIDGKRFNLGLDIRDGVYLADFDNFYSIIEISNGEIKYILNRINKC